MLRKVLGAGVSPAGVHRPHGYVDPRHAPCAVVRTVSRSEWSVTPNARAAMDTEWNKLMTLERQNPKDTGSGAWDMSSVRELSEVKAEACKKGKKCIMERLPNCVLKSTVNCLMTIL